MTDRYRIQITAAVNDEPMLNVKCADCGVTIFSWRSTLPFSYSTLVRALAIHDNDWHAQNKTES